MINSHSLGQTSRARLASDCHEIRAQLKEWEKEFAEANSGSKPGKADIKRNPEIAAKYKTYNRTRNVLDGKKELDSLKSQSPSLRRHKSASSLTTAQQDQGETQRQAHQFDTPRKTQKLHLESHPSILDPYDAPPASVSPHAYVFRNTIGPTPQRDGTILGLFDLLSRSGSASSSRKRKVDAMEGKTVGMNVAQTPSKRPARGGGDLFDRLAEDSGGRRHTRTPVSDGKKLLLSQFFASPSTMRFTAIVGGDDDGDDDDTNEKKEVDRTPLRSRVLAGRAESTAENENAFDMTPAYLRRTTSFNQRLLTASGSTSQNPSSKSNPIFGSPSTIRSGPSKRPFKGRGLSEILRGLRQMEDNDDEDEMDALREMEGTDVDVLVGDSQSLVKPSVAEELPARSWKKKGQKRTTRRVIMRPTTTQRQPRMTESEEEADVVDGEVVEVRETQGNEIQAEFGQSEDELQPPADTHEDEENKNNSIYEINVPAIAEAEEEEEEEQDETFADSDYDELPPPQKAKLMPYAKRRDTTPNPKMKKKKKRLDRNGKGKEKGVINPNAVSHMNFRSLKIRNRNSKAGGKGRFGKGRR